MKQHVSHAAKQYLPFQAREQSCNYSYVIKKDSSAQYGSITSPHQSRSAPSVTSQHRRKEMPKATLPWAIFTKWHRGSSIYTSKADTTAPERDGVSNNQGTE